VGKIRTTIIISAKSASGNGLSPLVGIYRRKVEQILTQAMTTRRTAAAELVDRTALEILNC